MGLSCIKVFTIFATYFNYVLSENVITNQVGLLEPFYLDEYLNGTFINKGWNGTWVTDDVFLTKDENQDLYKVVVSELRTELFLKADVFSNFSGSSFMFTSDLKYVLIRYNQKAVFRHSKTAQYSIYDVGNHTYYHLADKKHLQLAKWVPVGTSLIYVLENNIYYVPRPEDVTKPVQITKDGIPGIIYNGVPDWVYEEEILGSGSAIWFSPNGQRLAFASFDDRAVNEFHYFIYGEPGQIENQYPKVVTLKYPKVGTTNPKFAVKYVDLQNPDAVVELRDIVPVNYVTEDNILGDVTWATDDDIVVITQNRIQNVAAVTRCNLQTQDCKEIHVTEESRGWLEITVPRYSKDGTKFLTIASEFEGNDSFKHVVLVNRAANPIRTRLTFGKRVVLGIYGWDEKRDLIYYLATGIDDPSQQHIYVVHISSKLDRCLTCNFDTPEGPCQFAAAMFSKELSYFTKICQGPGPSVVHVQNTETLSYFVWENNTVLRTQLLKKLTPVRKTIKVPIEGGFKARVVLLLPPDLDENSTVKYPMIVNVYAGPNSNRISKAFSLGIENYFVTSRKYIYAWINARGSGKAGDNIKYTVYRKLGTVEIEDQITVTKYLQDHYPYIDATRTGIWGWSYGGFVTLWALIKDINNVFKFGVAVAPVTNFIYYDSIYTERYMGLPIPEDNLSGYNNTDVIRRVEALRNKNLLLIHGNADDNVHYQQSMLLAKALEKADIQFQQQSYPDENHSLTGVSRHLYHTIDRFFDYAFRSTHPMKWKYRKTQKKY